MLVAGKPQSSYMPHVLALLPVRALPLKFDGMVELVSGRKSLTAVHHASLTQRQCGAMPCCPVRCLSMNMRRLEHQEATACCLTTAHTNQPHPQDPDYHQLQTALTPPWPTAVTAAAAALTAATRAPQPAAAA